MPISENKYPYIGVLIKKGIKIGENLDQQYPFPEALQKHPLKKLLILANETAFGKRYQFSSI